jgi:hypothetical protein
LKLAKKIVAECLGINLLVITNKLFPSNWIYSPKYLQKPCLGIEFLKYPSRQVFMEKIILKKYWFSAIYPFI